MITALLSGPRHRDLQAGWVMVALGLLALLLQNSPVVGPVRIVVVLAFVVAGPGVTVVGPRRDGDLATRLSVSIGASLALATFVAQAMIWIHHWQPTEALVLLELIAVGAMSIRTWRSIQSLRIETS